MSHPVLRAAALVLAVAGVVVGLKLFGLAPDVFTPQTGDRVSLTTPFGDFRAGDQGHSWFRPLLLTHILSVPALWRLCQRLGFSGWFSLAMLVPLANILLLYFLAFTAWPLETPQNSAALAGRDKAAWKERTEQAAVTDRPGV